MPQCSLNGVIMWTTVLKLKPPKAYLANSWKVPESVHSKW
jgi:hypothetical protein